MRVLASRRFRQIIWGLYITSLVCALCLILGPLINDHKIASNQGRALARVIAVTDLRTTIDYQDETGQFHTPPEGVLYPGNLGPGQLVWVNYSKDNPDLVKVEGRTWRLALIPAGSVALSSTIIAAIVISISKRMAKKLT
ncbi:DUF3592 domain-containing protein [Corynebacterium aquilae]|uniref:DUF3592 domain-containing protein n=1 Tax=Corynebacterium aquilae DSM 44791 TaxID=1431546 RepID=A0A1L7CDP3_9CORY|nr:DUF3592 domain-containing protein [Corynebacterium aquilae]APT83971.1 hypothetical protein CAQU_01540 [Corynebacterium aquilae DSM 44791]